LGAGDLIVVVFVDVRAENLAAIYGGHNVPAHLRFTAQQRCQKNGGGQQECKPGKIRISFQSFSLTDAPRLCCHHLEAGAAAAAAACSGTGRLASFKARSRAARTWLIGTAPSSFCP